MEDKEINSDILIYFSFDINSASLKQEKEHLKLSLQSFSNSLSDFFLLSYQQYIPFHIQYLILFHNISVDELENKMKQKQ